MIARLAEFVTTRPLLSIIGVVALIVVGLRSYLSLPIDAVPDLTNVQVQVLTSAPGLSPTEVERLVTQPVELSMTGVPHLARIRSISRAAVSAVTLVFDDDVELGTARELVAQRLSAARESIPPTAGRPALGPLTTSLGEIYHFTMTWPGHSLREIRTLLDWDVAYRLRSVPGVVEVNSWGGETRQVQVRLKEGALLANRLTPGEVESALLGAGQNVSGGFIERSEEGTFVRALGAYATREDVARQVVATRVAAGVARPIFVEDVADVLDAAAPRFAAATADGHGETVYTMVQMIADGNAHQIVRRVKDRLAEITKGLPQGAKIEPFYDRAAFVDRVLDTVQKNLLEGGVIVTSVLLLMLGNLRAGLIVASVIPLAMLGAFTLMRWFGISGNLLSLGAIDFGLVVDGSVVVVEGALTAMLLHRWTARQAMRGVAAEMGRAVTTAVVIIAVVYVPVLLLEGTEGKMFRPMALTVLFALATALVLTFTWVPAIGALLLRAEHREPRLVQWLRAAYQPLVAAVVSHWKFAFGGVCALLAVGIAVAATRGAEFIPRLEEGDVAIQITRPPSVSLEEAARGTTDVERALRRFPEVVRVVSRTGSPDVATDVMGLDQSDVFVILKPRAEWKTASDAAGLANAFEPVLRRALPGAVFGFTQPIEMRVQELIGGVKADVGVKIFGDDLARLRELGERVAKAIADTPGSADVRMEATSGLRLLTLKPDTRRLGRSGARAADFLAFVEMLRTGRAVGRLIEGERRFDIVLRAGQSPAADDGPIQALRLPLADGKSAKLGDLAAVAVSEGPAQVSREQGRRRVLLEANVRGRDLAGFVQDLRQRVARLELPPGYWIEYGGQYENLARATTRLAVVVPLTLGAILVLLYLAFDSIRPALLIFVNVPAAATGGVIALALRELSLSISAAVGFLALFGVATLNGVVLLASVRERQRSGEPTESAVVSAATDRMRPVLVTALVAALGFLPMALATGAGSEVQRPLATVVIGGLVTASLVTLLALPAFYVRFGGKPDPDTEGPDVATPTDAPQST
ncbi:MAG TPA: CusA/CzcA family heavy metal efflux RND transporter [Polyangiaceae bacterium]|nr:CusA/CzcA family heavy metal efflux RND transporter [Polyangiaceae bacterium]